MKLKKIKTLETNTKSGHIKLNHSIVNGRNKRIVLLEIGQRIL